MANRDSIINNWNAPDCSICFSKLATQLIALIPCGHMFHADCWDRLVGHTEKISTLSCPVCRTKKPKILSLHYSLEQTEFESRRKSDPPEDYYLLKTANENLKLELKRVQDEDSKSKTLIAELKNSFIKIQGLFSTSQMELSRLESQCRAFKLELGETTGRLKIAEEWKTKHEPAAKLLELLDSFDVNGSEFSEFKKLTESESQMLHGDKLSYYLFQQLEQEKQMNHSIRNDYKACRAELDTCLTRLQKLKMMKSSSSTAQNNNENIIRIANAYNKQSKLFFGVPLECPSDSSLTTEEDQIVHQNKIRKIDLTINQIQKNNIKSNNENPFGYSSPTQSSLNSQSSNSDKQEIKYHDTKIVNNRNSVSWNKQLSSVAQKPKPKKGVPISQIWHID